MLNTWYLTTAVSVPLLVLACGGDAWEPLGPAGKPSQLEITPAAPLASAQASRRHEIRSFASATFLSTDPSGCIESIFDVFGSEERVKDEQPGAPSTTGFALVLVDRFDQCTGTSLGQIAGDISSDAIAFETTGNLATATLQATIPALDFVSGAEVNVTLNVTWTGFGSIFPEVNKVRLKTPEVLQIFHFKATIREASTSGTASLGGETFALEPLAPGQIGRAKSGTLIVQFD